MPDGRTVWFFKEKGFPLNDNSEFDSDAVPSDPIGCPVEAHAYLRVPFEEIAALRKNPGPSLGTKIPVSLLKHADPQTVLGLAALLRAADEAGWRDRSFADWAVIASPRFLGRVASAMVIDRFLRMGASGMSPMIIPTLSLHATAGSLSLAIQSHGFNYGVGGGPGHLTEALLAGLASRDDGGCPGVWVVATGFDPEPIPDLAGNSVVPAFGHAVALALVPEATGQTRLNLRMVPTAAAGPEPRQPAEHPTLAALGAFLTDAGNGIKVRRWFASLPGGGAFEIEDNPARGVAAGDRRSFRAG